MKKRFVLMLMVVLLALQLSGCMIDVGKQEEERNEELPPLLQRNVSETADYYTAAGWPQQVGQTVTELECEDCSLT